MKRVMNVALYIFTAVTVFSCSGEDNVPAGSGLIEATEVIISAETSGRVESLFFDEGDKIVHGETLARIDTVTAALQLQQAQALYKATATQKDNAEIRIDKAQIDLNLARKEFDRVSQLIKSGSANQQTYDRAETTYSQAQLAVKAARADFARIMAELEKIDADIALLRKRLNDCVPVCPISGTVTTAYVEVGELVSIGRPLFKIAQLDTVWVKVYLPPGDLTQVVLGDKAEIDPEDGRTEPLEGTITWISAEAEFTPKNVQTKEARADLVYAVKISIANTERSLKIGMPVSVRIP